MDMSPPKCRPYPPSTRYKEVVVRSLWYDGETLAIEVQGEGFVFARVIFRHPAGFRMLDESDLCEFWNDYHTGNGGCTKSSRGLDGIGIFATAVPSSANATRPPRVLFGVRQVPKHLGGAVAGDS
jgi:hypothetical protein